MESMTTSRVSIQKGRLRAILRSASPKLAVKESNMDLKWISFDCTIILETTTARPLRNEKELRELYKKAKKLNLVI